MVKKIEIHICMITDNNYVVPTAVAMTSAIHNKKSGSIYHFHLLINDVSADNLERLSQLCRKDVKIDFIEVDASKYDTINVKTHVPKSAALKFDIPNLIKTDKVLYIDGDIIVCRDLSELYEISLDDYLVAGVRDMVGELVQKFNKIVGCDKYFNSGMLLLDLKKMREGNYSDLLIKAKMEHPQWRCMDQDVFNYVLSSKTKWLDVRYNCTLPLYKWNEYSISDINDFYGAKYNNEKELEENAVIIHLAGTPWQRPWQYRDGMFCSLWDKYYDGSPFRDQKLEREKFRYPTWRKLKKLKNVRKYLLFGFIPLLNIEEQ